MRSVYDVLEERGFIAQCTDDGLRDKLANEAFTVYVGFDPTADSLHLGHVVPLMAMSHFQNAGHHVLLVVGGATGMVGDPSGRSDERNLLTPSQVAANIESVKVQLARFLDFSCENPPKLLDNNEWTLKMSFIDWLREVGKYFTVNYMLAKDSVKSRLGSDQGISFTEFSYMTMQANDFRYLFENEGCTLQCGGNDQWGNITAGIDLIRKLHQKPAYGLTFPLIMTSSGEKFGKSAGNALWLDPERTSPWDFYQYFVRQDDRDVINLLKIYTFMPVDEINALEEQLKTAPERREAQRRLASEVTKIIHGEDVASEMERAAEIVYHSEIKDLADATLQAVFANVPSTELPWADLDAGMDIIELLATTGLMPSKGEARRRLKAGGVYVNNVRVEVETTVGRSHLASNSFIVLRSGKKNYHLLKLV